MMMIIVVIEVMSSSSSLYNAEAEAERNRETTIRRGGRSSDKGVYSTNYTYNYVWILRIRGGANQMPDKPDTDTDIDIDNDIDNDDKTAITAHCC